MSYTGIGDDLEHSLKKSTASYLNNMGSSLKNDLSETNNDLYQKVIKLYEGNNIEKAIKVLKKSGKETSKISYLFGFLYAEQKEYEKAETVYLKALESGYTGALINLGNLYREQKEPKKAEEYYLKAIESGNKNVLSALAWHYFEQANKKEKALKYTHESYNDIQNYQNTHTLAVIELWVENFSSSYEKFLEWMKYEDAVSAEYDVSLYLNLLIAKGQFYKAKEFMELPKYQLKERYKPIWYALMILMQDDFPHEIKKMGSELKGTVDEVLEEIKRLKVKYALQ